ncbi:hypothetical protein VOLCADRAFT_98948 [Volvox carteri f. nagariensis]|uniref:Uncharacterized protein n=1 Tax=Volvox carteri f. nagariensis TaxID=3068 RepID=D8UGP4_VOLCA|nr:uncharacterized protein VOLCADRAFT_98948 [Volvox carteri f. nagariensis]EFJ41065.1 hypothetical protein VOLCADRAFT_98948 [Volvox carteri f. nagariensis]|eukprot:XP_002957828.1 hypothetical protein VOLCADRAFT_98948 [Volvox carteri f. nagariensis]
MKNTVTNSAIGRGRNWKICVMNAVSRTTITSTFQRAMFRVSSVSRPMLGLGDMERRGDDMLGLGVQSKQVKQELMISKTFSVGFDGRDFAMQGPTTACSPDARTHCVHIAYDPYTVFINVANGFSEI